MSSTKNKQVLKSGVWYIFGNFLVKGIGFLTTPFFARLMTKEDVGDYILPFQLPVLIIEKI